MDANSKSESLSQAVINFDLLPDSANVGIKDASIVAGRAKPTLYRDAAKGLIQFIKIGHSTRIRVGELRRYLNGGAV
jgi:hypothetical protein